MSQQGPFGGRNRALSPALPRGAAVAVYESYPEAQAAVDLLAKADFPVDQVSIVGSDLKTVERVTGKLTWGRVAAAGAASGAWLGLFFGLLILIFSPVTSFAYVLAALLIGAGFGMLFGLVSYAINRRRKDYTSIMQVLASSYSVIVADELVNRARNTLATGGPAGPANPAADVPHPSEPPRAAPPQADPRQDEPPQPGPPAV